MENLQTADGSAVPASDELRVTQISTNDVRGGAARAAHRLHRALAGAAVRSRMLVAQRFGEHPDDEIIEFNAFAPAPAIVGQAFFRLGRRWHRPPVRQAGAFFSPDWSFTGWRLLSQVPPSDVVNLHWVADLLDYRTLPRLVARAPVVWTFHDMNAFTGGCHYSGICVRYRDACGACPQLITSAGERDMTWRVLRRKAQIFSRVAEERMIIVCPSAWLAAEAKLSALFERFDVRVIPNGIDLEEFFPVEQMEARRLLKLPPHARIILFVADLIDDQRKGFDLLVSALRELGELKDLLLVTLGRGGVSLPANILSHRLGEIHDSAQLRAAYSAADVFAIPTLQDNLPNTILESMACGTPVAGFRVGGVGEAVVDGRTGLLAEPGNALDLARALRRLIEDRPLRATLAKECRPHVERHYSVQLQARRYASLYDEIRQRTQENTSKEFTPV